MTMETQEQEPQGYNYVPSRDIIDALRRLAEAQEKANRLVQLRAEMDYLLILNHVNQALAALKEIREA